MKCRLGLALLLAAARVFAGPEELVDAERAFADTAARLGLRAAFEQFVPPDGILFRPRPVTRRDYFAGDQGERGALAWSPAYARIARAGDAGFTTGPFQYRAEATNDVVSATGQFVTLWRRTAEGWRAVLDLGVTGPAEAFPWAADTHGRDDADEPIPEWQRGARGRDLRYMDDGFARLAARGGEGAALTDFAHKRVRVLRDGEAPVLGRRAAAERLGVRSRRVRDERRGLFIADGGDLAWTWGESTPLVSGPGSPPAVRGWVRVWRRGGWGGTWRVALDAAVEYPAER